MAWNHEQKLIRLTTPELGYARICSVCDSIRQCVMLSRKANWKSDEKLHICAHCIHSLAGVFLPRARKPLGPLNLPAPTVAPAPRPSRRLLSKRKPRSKNRRRLGK